MRNPTDDISSLDIPIKAARYKQDPELQPQSSVNLKEQRPTRRHNLLQWPRPAPVEEPWR